MLQLARFHLGWAFKHLTHGDKCRTKYRKRHKTIKNEYHGGLGWEEKDEHEILRFTSLICVLCFLNNKVCIIF